MESVDYRYKDYVHDPYPFGFIATVQIGRLLREWKKHRKKCGDPGSWPKPPKLWEVFAVKYPRADIVVVNYWTPMSIQKHIYVYLDLPQTAEVLHSLDDPKEFSITRRRLACGNVGQLHMIMFFLVSRPTVVYKPTWAKSLQSYQQTLLRTSSYTSLCLASYAKRGMIYYKISLVRLMKRSTDTLKQQGMEWIFSSNEKTRAMGRIWIQLLEAKTLGEVESVDVPE